MSGDVIKIRLTAQGVDLASFFIHLAMGSLPRNMP